MGFTVSPDLIIGAQRGGAPLDALLTELWPEAYRVAFGILRDRGYAEDAAQDACASIARALADLRSVEAFYAWMYRIIVRHATLVAKRQPDVSALDAVAEFPTMSRDEEQIDLWDAIAALPLPQRTAIVLRYYAGLNSSEIAVAQGTPAATVRFHLMLAKRALRVALGDLVHAY